MLLGQQSSLSLTETSFPDVRLIELTILLHPQGQREGDHGQVLFGVLKMYQNESGIVATILRLLSVSSCVLQMGLSSVSEYLSASVGCSRHALHSALELGKAVNGTALRIEETFKSSHL